jgi:hypothetical protein
MGVKDWMSMQNDSSPTDEDMFNELLHLSERIDADTEFNKIIEESMVELKNDDFMPIFDEFYGSVIVNSYEVKAANPCWPGYVQLGMKKGKGRKMVPNCIPVETKSAEPLHDPKGGLTAAGRKHFKNKEGANLKPGVKGPANTPQKMRRKGSFLTRFFTNPSGPMIDEKGRATRLALSAAAWGEPVPKNAEDAAILAAKGKRLLEKYANTKKKQLSFNEEIKALTFKKKPIDPDLRGIDGATDINLYAEELIAAEKNTAKNVVEDVDLDLYDDETEKVDAELAKRRAAIKKKLASTARTGVIAVDDIRLMPGVKTRMSKAKKQVNTDIKKKRKAK